MKNTAIYFLCGCFLGVALATSIPPVPLETRVRSSDHIFIGVATGLQLVDGHGNPTNARDKDRIGLTYSLTIRPADVLKSNIQPFPSTLVVTNSHSMVVTFESEKARFVGKKLVYLLTGTNFAPVNAYQFTEMPATVTNIIKLIQSERAK